MMRDMQVRCLWEKPQVKWGCWGRETGQRGWRGCSQWDLDVCQGSGILSSGQWGEVREVMMVGSLIYKEHSVYSTEMGLVRIRLRIRRQ
jgi:hypothetical protein